MSELTILRELEVLAAYWLERERVYAAMKSNLLRDIGVGMGICAAQLQRTIEGIEHALDARAEAERPR